MFGYESDKHLRGTFILWEATSHIWQKWRQIRCVWLIFHSPLSSMGLWRIPCGCLGVTFAGLLCHCGPTINIKKATSCHQQLMITEWAELMPFRAPWKDGLQWGFDIFSMSHCACRFGPAWVWWGSMSLSCVWPSPASSSLAFGCYCLLLVECQLSLDTDSVQEQPVLLQVIDSADSAADMCHRSESYKDGCGWFTSGNPRQAQLAF